MGELVEESPQESEIDELQVPRLVQVPWDSWLTTLSLDFLPADRRATAAPLNVNSGVTGSTALYDWQSKWKDVPAKASFLKSQPLRDVKLFIKLHFKDCFFNDGKERTKHLLWRCIYYVSLMMKAKLLLR